MTTVFEKERSTTPIIQEKEKRKAELENTIRLLMEERANASDINMKALFDEQYLKACNEYKLIGKELEALQEKEGNEIDIASRYKKIQSLIAGNQVTPEMINKDILDVFLYRIIVLGRNEVVFTINASHTMPLETLRQKRKEVAEREPIYEGTTKCKGLRKTFKLHYKVVIV